MENQQNNPQTPEQPSQPLPPPPLQKTAKPEKVRKPRLNPKQALFVKLFTTPGTKCFGNGYQSAVEAGYSDQTARRITADLSEKVRLTMSEALDQAGATDEKLAERHVELLNKREVIVAGRGEDASAEVTDQPDTQAVKAALDMAYKLKRHYPAEGFGHDLPAGTVIFISPNKDGRGTQGNPTEAASG